MLHKPFVDLGDCVLDTRHEFELVARRIEGACLGEQASRMHAASRRGLRDPLNRFFAQRKQGACRSRRITPIRHQAWPYRAKQISAEFVHVDTSLLVVDLIRVQPRIGSLPGIDGRLAD